MDKITELTIDAYNKIAKQYAEDFFDNEDDQKIVNKKVICCSKKESVV